MPRHAAAGTDELPFHLPTIDEHTPETLALERERRAQLRRTIENLSNNAAAYISALMASATAKSPKS